MNEYTTTTIQRSTIKLRLTLNTELGRVHSNTILPYDLESHLLQHKRPIFIINVVTGNCFM